MSNVCLPECKNSLVSKPLQETHRTNLLDRPLDFALSLATGPRDVTPRDNGGVGHGEGPQCEGDVATHLSREARWAEEDALEALARPLLDHDLPWELSGKEKIG